ncbi:MAG: PEP/pyruvate-binding domain-containing protein [bacterium]
MDSQRIYFFGDHGAEGDPARKDILGGKGASLAAMSKAGLPVPPGFIISTACCREFLENDGKWPDGLEVEVKKNLARLERLTGRTYGANPPLLVSVRSGAAVSMPGMMDTILNCGLNPGLAESMGQSFWPVYAQFVLMFGKTVAGIRVAEFEAIEREVMHVEAKPGHDHERADPAARYRELARRYSELYTQKTGRPFPANPRESLTQCIEAVFGSWNNERAVTYRREHDIRGCLGTAVTVQAMFPSEVSGIVFTANPNNIEDGEMVIESAYGLGEAVVSGDVHPDNFIVDRTTYAIKRRTISHKMHRVAALGDDAKQDADATTLTDAQIKELAGICMNIERYFGSPMDIEWGLADGKFSLLQSRPIRGLEIVEDIEVGRKEEIHRLRELEGSNRKVWIQHNLSETLPTPTPLTWDIVRRFMSGNGGFGRMYRDFGYTPSPTVCEQGFLELICGRIYADPQRAAEMFWSGMPLCYDLNALAKNPKLIDAAPSGFDAERADVAFLANLPGLVRKMMKCSKTMKAVRRTVVERFEQEVLPPYLAWVREKRHQDLQPLSTNELVAELRARMARVLDDFAGESLKPGFFGGIAEASLSGLLEQLMGQETGRQLAMSLTQGLEGDTTVQQGIAMCNVARGRLTLADFIEQYGHRTVEEMELSRPRWREDHSYVTQILGVYLDPSAPSPEAQHTLRAEKREALERTLPGLLAQWGGSSLLEDVLADLQDAQKMLPYRESGKHYLMMGYETIRQVIVELGKRWDLGRDVFFLTLDDLESYETRREALQPVCASRKIRWQSAKRLEMPVVIDTNDLANLGVPKTYEAATELAGEPIAPGVASGIARLVYDPQKAADLCTDYVLVCPSTDPGWAALFVRAKALIVERGGVLSHGAIVARDFGIPAIACPDATRRIPDKTLVRVDGNRGIVTLLSEDAKR